jgi:hypothetical protein
MAKLWVRGRSAAASSFANSGAYNGTGIQDRLNTSFAAITYATNGPANCSQGL